ncbi:MAG: hypothetical protein ACRDLA_12540 [Thermoleophilaceae bacterium]
MMGATLGLAVATVLAGWDGEPLLERDVFGTTDPERIATLVEQSVLSLGGLALQAS